MNIAQDTHLQQFFTERNPSEKTIESYIYYITNYCKITRLTPTQMIDQAYEDYENKTLRPYQLRIKKHFTDYAEWMETKRLHS